MSKSFMVSRGVVATLATLALLGGASVALAYNQNPPYITSATLNGHSTVSVAANASITAAVTGESHDTNSSWGSVEWGVVSYGSSVYHCVNIDDIGHYSSTTVFSITAPGSNGTYNANFQGFSDNSCQNDASSVFTLTGGVVVGASTVNTTTTITSDSPDPSTVGNAYSVQVSVARASGSNQPSGSVSVSDGTGATCTISSISGSNGTSTGSCNLTSTTSGTKTLTATYNGDSNFNTSSDTESHTVNKNSQTITVGTPAPSSATYGTSFSVGATAPGGAVVITTSGGCTNAGTVVTMTSGATSCVVKYDQSGNSSYSAAPEVTENVSANTMAISVTASPETKVYGASDPDLSYTTNVALIGNDSFTGALTRDEGEDVGLYSITQGSLNLDSTKYTLNFTGNTFSITPADATVTLDIPSDVVYDGNPHGVTVSTIPEDGFDVTTTYNDNVYPNGPTDAGSYDVVASASSTDPDYSNGSAEGTLTIAQADQTIDFDALNDRTLAEGDFDVSATSTSGLNVTFAASGMCEMTGDEGTTVHLTGIGTCTITASQEGNTDYFAADDVNQVFNILPPAAPVLNPNSVVFRGSMEAAITSEDGTTIHYTFGTGVIPTCDSDLYTDPFTFSDAVVLNAVACDASGNVSDVVSASYSPAGGDGGGSGSGAPAGQVLGAEIGPDASTTPPVASSTPPMGDEGTSTPSTLPTYGNGLCTPGHLYLNGYTKLGGKNDPAQVTLLQQFLNQQLGLSIPITGFYGPLTYKAVKAFQSLHPTEVFQPWTNAGFTVNQATGYVYKTTTRLINMIYCGLTSDALPPVTLP